MLAGRGSHRVVHYHRRWYAESEPLTQPSTIEDEVADLRALWKLCTSSMGRLVALVRKHEPRISSSRRMGVISTARASGGGSAVMDLHPRFWKSSVRGQGPPDGAAELRRRSRRGAVDACCNERDAGRDEADRQGDAARIDEVSQPVRLYRVAADDVRKKPAGMRIAAHSTPLDSAASTPSTFAWPMKSMTTRPRITRTPGVPGTEVRALEVVGGDGAAHDAQGCGAH